MTAHDFADHLDVRRAIAGKDVGNIPERPERKPGEADLRAGARLTTYRQPLVERAG